MAAEAHGGRGRDCANSVPGLHPADGKVLGRESRPRQAVVIIEAESGRTVHVASGGSVALRLTGRADPAYEWNLDVLNQKLIQTLPRPQVL